MRTIETPENYRNAPLSNPRSIDDYDCRFPEKYNYYDRTPIGFLFSERSTEKVEPTYISLEVDGITYSVPSALADLVDEINDSKYIVTLENDWDNLGAVPISKELYKKAISFLLMYTIFIYKDDNKTVLQSPEINPCCNGSIDLSWSTVGARMLINVKFKEGRYLASFFGYPNSTKLPIEGLIDMDNIDKDIALWMKKLK